MVASGITVEGLADLRAELRQAGGPAMGRQLGKANKTAATLVANEATSRATSRGGSAAKGAGSIKPSAMQRAAAVTIGGPSAPWMLGAEFGARRYRQFPSWRGNQWNPDAGSVGYFLHPAIRDTRDEFIDAYTKALDDLFAKAFPD